MHAIPALQIGLTLLTEQQKIPWTKKEMDPTATSDDGPPPLGLLALALAGLAVLVPLAVTEMLGLGLGKQGEHNRGCCHSSLQCLESERASRF
jgi:hypothetical protein